MAVFTEVTASALAEWGREQFCFNQLSAPVPIAAGTENTNYQISGDGQHYIFTIFEFLHLPAVRYYIALTQHLANGGAPVPVPRRPRNPTGFMWGNKPCLLTPMVPGAPNNTPTVTDCWAFGRAIGNLHRVGAGFTRHRNNPRGLVWRQSALKSLLNKTCPETLSPAQIKILAQAAQQDLIFNQGALPKGACHCDLFRDNALWHEGRIAGIIDFYFGGTAELIFDLGVGACDWCFDDEGKFIPDRFGALMMGYRQERQLLEIEEHYFRDALQMAAYRFWLSRLHNLHFPRPAVLLTTKHPRRFEQIYRQVGKLDARLWTKRN